MNISIRVKAKNTETLHKVAEFAGMTSTRLATLIQAAALDHILLTEEELPDALKGKLTIKFHFIPGQGYLITYGLNAEPSTRLIGARGKSLFIRPGSGKGPGKTTGKVVSGRGAERPAITDEFGRAKLVEATILASQGVRSKMTYDAIQEVKRVAKELGLKIKSGVLTVRAFASTAYRR